MLSCLYQKDLLSVSKTKRPSAGLLIEWRWTLSILGINNPPEVDWMSSMALESGGVLLGEMLTWAKRTAEVMQSNGRINTNDINLTFRCCIFFF
jgi:hypothetical protein